MHAHARNRLDFRRRLLAACAVVAAALALSLLAVWASASTTLSILDARCQLSGSYQNVDALLGNSAQPINLSYVPPAYSNGTGANAVQVLHFKTYTIGSSSSTTLVMGNGSLADVFGNAATFAAVKEGWIGLASTNTASSVTIGGAASNPWEGAGLPLTAAGSKTTIVNGGGPFRFSNPSAGGFTVGAAATDQLKITNNDGSNSAIVVVFLAGK